MNRVRQERVVMRGIGGRGKVACSFAAPSILEPSIPINT